jgi:hypothetical protein
MVDFIIFVLFSLFYILMLTWFRMSCRQIVFILIFLSLSSIMYGIFANFYRVTILLICGALVEAIVTIFLYVLSFKKDLKFDEPIFKKGSMKIFMNGIRDIFGKRA